MNKIVAVSAVATVPTTAPALSAQPDAKLLELGRELERLRAIEEPLKQKMERYTGRQSDCAARN